MAENEKTAHYQIPKPNIQNNISDDTPVMQSAFDLIDLLLYGLALEIAKKMNSDASLTIENIGGLVDALSDKMAKSKTFKLAELTDVTGIESALDNYILTKAGTGFVLRSALAVIGLHTHAIADIVGLQPVLNTLIAGPSSAVEGEVSIYSGATGKVLKSSGVKFSDLLLSIADKATAAQLNALSASTQAALNTTNGNVTNRIIRDTASHVGFDVGNIASPYMRHDITGVGTLVYLATKASVDALPKGIGVDQTWQSVSRSVNTAYQNTTGRPLQVAVTVASTSLQVAVSANNSTWVGVGWVSTASTNTVSFIVPAGHYYRVSRGTGSAVPEIWAELY